MGRMTRIYLLCAILTHRTNSSANLKLTVMKTLLTTSILIATYLLSSSFGGQTDELYLNYVAAIKNESTFQYHLVIKLKNLNTGQTREICTEGNFLKGALHREYKLSYGGNGINKVEKIALDNKDRYFEFKNDSAMWNLGVENYSMDDLKELEKKINFDSLAAQIKKTKKWEKQISDDKLMMMYAHALFNRGVLTGENNCFGGTLQYVDKNKK